MVKIGEEVAVPMLMLAEKEGNEERREFFDLSKGVTYTMSFPELVGKRHWWVGIPGWILTADGRSGNMNLLHLNSRAQIELPRIDTLKGFNYDIISDYLVHNYVERAILSSNPHDSNEDYILMLIQGVPPSLAYWRPGYNGFITVETRISTYTDVTWHDGQFYAVNVKGKISILDFRGGSSQSQPTVGRVIKGLSSDFFVGVKVYIVHSLGELWVIVRDGIETNPETNTYGARQFDVYKVDVEKESYEEVFDLGNIALFLGFNATLAVEQDEYFKGNCVYFTDDCSPSYFHCERGGGKDMGIYNYLDGNIEPHYTGESYHRFSPPIWIFNSV